MGQHPEDFLDKYLDSDLCDFIVKEGKKLEASEGAVYEKKTSNKHQDDSIRKAHTECFEKGHWIESIVASALHSINQTTWQARLTSSENIQFGIYGQGEFYNEHRDIDLAT